jgi:tetratricopeptide (TPR) repeat protein
MGDYEGAKQKHEQALKIAEKVLGRDHPMVASILNNLGIYLHYLGDYEGARQKHEQALEIVGTWGLSRDHLVDVAQTLNNLGLNFQSLGEIESAGKCYERALMICQAKLGEDHPTTRIVRTNWLLNQLR